MTRLIAIVIFIALAILILRYTTNEKIQKWVVYGLSGSFVAYILYVFISELMR